MALDIKNLTVRTLSGIVYIGVIIGAILWGVYGVAILASVFTVFGIYELEKMPRDDNAIQWPKYLPFDCIAALSIIWGVSHISLYFLLGFALVFIFLRIVAQIFFKETRGFYAIAISCLSLIYIALPMAGFVILEIEFEYFPWVLVAIVSLIWINDTGAFLIGSLFGRHRLYEALSPKKSWEGFFGGMVFSIGAAIGYHFIFKGATPFPMSLLLWIFIGFIVTVASTIGDLFESMLKRNVGVKDSGKLIPGHGGILDRVDSLLFVVPSLLIIILISCF